MERELMALLIEVTSVGAAGKQLRKPIQVPRPKSGKGSKVAHPDQARAAAGGDPAYDHAVSVLRSTARPKAVTAA